MRAAWRSVRGLGRKENQDRVRADAAAGIFVVADGMGGAAAGGVAGALVADSVFESLEAAAGDGHRAIRGALCAAARRAHELVRREAAKDPSLEGMGSTLVAAMTGGERLFVCNVGDSRAYLRRGVDLIELSVPHSVAAEMLRSGLITGSAAAGHAFGHVLTMAVGSTAEPVPALREAVVRRGDLLVLCTDGIAGALGEEGLSALLSAEGADPERLCEKAVARAAELGETDDLTILVAELGP